MAHTPRIDDICKKLNLSKATVSKALNGYSSVREETRRKVLACAVELGYTHQMRTGEMNTRLIRVGLAAGSVVGNPDGISPNQLIISSLLEQLGSSHYDTVLIPPALLKEQTLPYEQSMRGLNLNCAFISGLRTDDPYYSQLLTTDFPTVMWDMPVDNPHVSNVSCNSVEGMRMAVAHLIGLGHRRIGLICGHLQAPVSLWRRDGYILALSDAGIPYDPDLVYYGDFSEAAGAIGMSYMKEKKVTAVACVCDVTALGAYRAAMAMKLRIPEDLSLVGYDNTNLTEYMTPNLTSVDQHPELIGRVIATAIDGHVRGKPVGDMLIRPSLIVRGSTAAPPAGS